MLETDLHGRRARRVRQRVTELAEQGLAPLELLAEVATEVRTVVPSVGDGWLALDPDTILPTGVISLDGGPAELQAEFFRNEFLEPDLNKFADVRRASRPVATLHATTGGRPQLSPHPARPRQGGVREARRHQPP